MTCGISTGCSQHIFLSLGNNSRPAHVRSWFVLDLSPVLKGIWEV